MSDRTDTFTVERSTTIAAPPEAVYAKLVDFHEWTRWSPWEGIDPALQRTYSGPASGVGAMYEWKGNRKVGQGRMVITGDDPPREVAIALDFIKPFKAHNACRFTLADTAGATTVTWTMTGPKTLLTKIMGIFTSMDKVVGRDFEKGLAQLKTAVEG